MFWNSDVISANGLLSGLKLFSINLNRVDNSIKMVTT